MKIFKRYAELLGWSPLVAILAVVAWVALGYLDRHQGGDTIGLLSELPAISVYALVAIGIASIAQRKFRKELTQEQIERYWELLMYGDRGALTVFIVDAIVWLVTLSLLLFLLLPQR